MQFYLLCLHHVYNTLYMYTISFTCILIYREGILRTDRDVQVFIQRCLEALSSGLDRELTVLRTMKSEWNAKNAKEYETMVDGSGDLTMTVLQPWDMAFFMHRLKNDRFEETMKKLK